MTLDEIDKALADWRLRLIAASNNVFELMKNLTYQRLTGEGGVPKADLTGLTLQEVTPALAAMREIWEMFALLQDVIERANGVRKSMSKIFVSQDKIRDIETLLYQPSVKLPSIKTPLTQRGLLTPAEVTQNITPQRLLEAMDQAFQTAKSAVMAVDEAWDHLDPALVNAQNDIDDLRKKSQTLGVGELPELADLLCRLTAMQKEVQSNPLGAKDGFDRDIKPQVERLRSMLAELARQRDAVQAELQKARQTMTRLKTLKGGCDAALAECSQTIEGFAALPRKDPGLLPSLDTRIGNMESHLADGSWTWQQVSKGLENWSLQAHAFEEADQKALEGYQGLSSQREELRGLLAVYKRRAEKHGVVEDHTLAGLAAQAEFHLHSPQRTPLDEVRQLVGKYRDRISVLTGADPQGSIKP